MIKYNLLFKTVLIFFILTSLAMTQEDDFPVLKGPYFGYEPPGGTPVKFPLDFLPDGYRLHSAPAFTPNGKEVYFSAMNFSVRFSEKIFMMRMSEGIWTPPEIAPFSGDFFDGSPSISRDGNYMFFSSARTMDQQNKNEKGERNIWFVKREGATWSMPKPLGFQTSQWENGTDLSAKGNLFFDSGDIYKVTFTEDSKLEPMKLGNAVNSNDTELHPCIAPDEQFLVFYSSRTGHFGSGGGDLYISFKDEDGSWQQAINLGKKFNEGHLSTSFPRLSPDGRYFFFLKLVAVPWEAEIYWVSSDAFDISNFNRKENDSAKIP
jgi:Tol biopolymer transport system component